MPSPLKKISNSCAVKYLKVMGYLNIAYSTTKFWLGLPITVYHFRKAVSAATLE